MSDNYFEKIFHQTKSLLHRYKKINELTGEEFNVFRILKLESSEVRMHSSFLAELLNPKGSHGQADSFLKLFIEKFCYRSNNFDSRNCEVRVEKYIGSKNEEDAVGGRLDICIRDNKNNFIIIENKIHARDQALQLLRYHNHAKDADLFYLTLEGNLPTENSKAHLKEGEDFKCLSFSENIIEWLEACRKEVSVIPIIREALTHYINLIKYLTHKTLNHTMEQELTEIMKANLKASFSIAGNLGHTMQQISNEFGKTVEIAVEKLGLFCNYDVHLGRNWSGIWIWKPEWRYVSIGFQFHSKNHNMVYGFTLKSKDGIKPNETPDKVKLALASLPNNEKRTGDWWPWFNYMEEPYRSWNTHQAYQAINDGRMLTAILENTQMLLQNTRNFQL